MAKTACLNGHGMWNGDGKPIVWAFRLNFYKQFQEENPDVILGYDKTEYARIYDCAENYPWEEPDIWYCDKCKSLGIFTNDKVDFHQYRLDYRYEEKEVFNQDEIDESWEEYVACRDDEFDKFEDDSMHPYDALIAFDFTYRCFVSADKRKIIVVDGNKKPLFGFVKAKETHFFNSYEIRLKKIKIGQKAVIYANNDKTYEGIISEVAYTLNKGIIELRTEKGTIEINKDKIKFMKIPVE